MTALTCDKNYPRLGWQENLTKASLCHTATQWVGRSTSPPGLQTFIPSSEFFFTENNFTVLKCKQKQTGIAAANSNYFCSSHPYAKAMKNKTLCNSAIVMA